MTLVRIQPSLPGYLSLFRRPPTNTVHPDLQSHWAIFLTLVIKSNSLTARVLIVKIILIASLQSSLP